MKANYLSITVMATVLALSACTTQSTTPSPSTNTTNKAMISLPFQALGNEPGWSVRIDASQQAEVLLDYGERTFTVALPTPEYSYAGTHYRSTYNQQPLALDILHATCSDTMSDTVYDYKAVLQVEGRVLRGCGRTLEN